MREGQRGKGQREHSATNTARSPQSVRLWCPCPARCLWPGTWSQHRWTSGQSPPLKGKPRTRGRQTEPTGLLGKGVAGSRPAGGQADGQWLRDSVLCHVTPWGPGESWRGAGGSGGPGPGGGHGRARAMVGARGAGAPLSSGHREAGHGRAQSCPCWSSPWIPGRSAGAVWGQREGGNENRGHGGPLPPEGVSACSTLLASPHPGAGVPAACPV